MDYLKDIRLKGGKVGMNNEMEEILDCLKDDSKSFIICSNYKKKILLDYITNLQQENQELNDSVTWWNNRFNA